MQLRKRRFYILHGCTHGPTFDARRNRHQLSGVLAIYLRLASEDVDARDALQRQHMPVRCTQAQLLHLGDPCSQVAQCAHAHADDLLLRRNLACDSAAKQLLDLGRDCLRIHPIERGLLPIDLDVDRIARDHDAVLDADDTANLTDRLRYPRRQVFQNAWIAAEKLDLDRLRNCGQVADHIFDQLR